MLCSWLESIKWIIVKRQIPEVGSRDLLSRQIGLLATFKNYAIEAH